MRLTSVTALSLSLLASAAAVGCGGGGDTSADAAPPDAPPLTDATSLACPDPGDLPFRLMSTGFQTQTSATIAMEDPRDKDEASDTLGVPGGEIANVYIDDSASPAAGPVDFHGRKAVNRATSGISGNPLPGEFVSLWTYDSAMTAWNMLGRGTTDSNGYYDFPSTGYTPANGQPVYAMLEANGTCAEHFTYLLPAGTKVIVYDIDGTLTVSDAEIDMQIADDTYVPVQMGDAVQLTQAWAAKHYQAVYLTARPHVLLTETRTWLESQGFAPGPVITENDFEEPQAYKTLWLQRLVTDFGWDVYAAYGNADTDIAAYNAVGIPKDVTFIVGPEGGSDDTVAIPDLDFTSHVQTFVDAQPDAN